MNGMKVVSAALALAAVATVTGCFPDGDHLEVEIQGKGSVSTDYPVEEQKGQMDCRGRCTFVHPRPLDGNDSRHDICAKADAGWYFDHWEGYCGKDNPLHDCRSIWFKDAECKAVFSPLPDSNNPASACGLAGQPCCENDQCATSLNCNSGRCRPCGETDQPCCAGNGCDQGTTCFQGVCRVGVPAGLCLVNGRWETDYQCMNQARPRASYSARDVSALLSGPLSQ